MTTNQEFIDGTSFKRICPECGVGNPEEADNCIICDKDLSETLLFFEDEFYDMELTRELLVEYRKNFYRTRRTGKVKKYFITEIKDVKFGHPIKRFSFKYNGKKEVYAIKEDNYNSLMGLFKKMGVIYELEVK
jgi:ribosomal protein L40E